MSNNTRAFLDMAGAHLTMLFYAREVRTYSKVILKVPLMQPAVHAAAPLGKHAPAGAHLTMLFMPVKYARTVR